MKMAKHIDLTIHECYDCPYCIYDGDSGNTMNAQDGHYCMHPDISGVGKLTQWKGYGYNKGNPRGYMGYQELYDDIPDWCPLDDE